MQKKNLLTSILFLIAICFPLVLQLLEIKLKIGNSENRKLATLPEFNIDNLKQAGNLKNFFISFYRETRSYKDNYDRYYQDNFLLKDLFYDYYNQIQISFFNKSPLPDKVVFGKNGWYFLGDSYSDVILESKGIKVFSNDELTNLIKTLKEKQKWLRDKNIGFYIAVAPNTHTVYGEYLPVKGSERSTKLEQLKKVSEHNGINFPLSR